MSQQIDLNRVREAVLAAREQNNNQVPNLFVGDQGQIVLTSPKQQPRVLSRIPSQRFAVSDDKLRKMPPGTRRWMSPDGTRGLLWEMWTELGDKYIFFSYLQADGWQSLVIEPPVEHHFLSPHTGHLFSDGRICFGETLFDLEKAYAKTVLWANGFAVAMRTGSFPW